jgi:hypothetical protein
MFKTNPCPGVPVRLQVGGTSFASPHILRKFKLRNAHPLLGERAGVREHVPSCPFVLMSVVSV